MSLAAALVAGSAAAQTVNRVEIGEIADGYTFYNRPGATLELHNRELGECVKWTRWPGQLDPYRPQGTGPSAALRGLMFGLIWSGPIAGLAAVPVENCMIVRGWRVVRVPEADGKILSEAPLQTLVEQLSGEVGTARPNGTIVRQWGNEALHPGAYHTASRPRAPGPQMLSVRLLSATSPEPLPTFPFPEQPRLDRQWPKVATKPDAAATAPAGSGIIVVHVTGISMSNGTGVTFMRVGIDPEDHPSYRDNAPELAGAHIGILSAKREGNWFLLAVPPGTWRFAASGFVDYCLGSPGFDVNAGEVVYAGSFSLAGPDLTPDLAVEPAAAWLGGDAGSRVRPAVYRNGLRGSCHDIRVHYALEFPGAPFEPGYTWGSASLH